MTKQGEEDSESEKVEGAGEKEQERKRETAVEAQECRRRGEKRLNGRYQKRLECESVKRKKVSENSIQQEEKIRGRGRVRSKGGTKEGGRNNKSYGETVEEKGESRERRRVLSIVGQKESRRTNRGRLSENRKCGGK